MSSFQLAINQPSSPDHPSLYKAKNPLHVAFSEDNDALACLWEDGYLQLWSLNTRIDPGSGKVINPNKIWEGRISESPSVGWRQVSFNCTDGSGGSWNVVVLGNQPTAEEDIVQSVFIDQGKLTKSSPTTLESRNCKLVGSTWPVHIQTPKGEVHTRK